jgi:hypothetical protein
MKKQFSKLNKLTFTLLLAASPSFAQFTISISNYGGATGNASAVQALDELVAELESSINENLSDIPSTSTFISGAPDAAILAGSGLSASYNTNFKLFMAGFQLGAAFDPGTAKLFDLFSGEGLDKIEGAGVDAGFIVGMPLGLFTKANIGPIKLENTKVFAHLLSLPKRSYFGPLAAGITSVGVGAMYKLLPEVGAGMGLVRWGGLDLTSGLRYASIKIEFQQELDPIEMEQDLGGTFGQATATYEGTVTAGAHVTALTLPMEASSSVRLLYFLDLFAGLGVDLSLGSGKVIAEVDGPINIEGSADLGTVVADGTLDLGSNSKPNPINLRYFAGLGFDMFAVNLSAKYSQMITSGAKGISVGVTAYW